MMTTTPAGVGNNVRNAVYTAMALIALAIFSGGLLPLLMQDVRALTLLTLYCGLLGGVPLLLMRTKFFDRLVTSGAGQDHPLAPLHLIVSRVLVAVMIFAIVLMVWRASLAGLPGWKGGFLLVYGWGLFCAAGWLLRAPRFMLRETS